jgi:hypothetical protein
VRIRLGCGLDSRIYGMYIDTVNLADYASLKQMSNFGQ